MQLGAQLRDQRLQPRPGRRVAGWCSADALCDVAQGRFDVQDRATKVARHIELIAAHKRALSLVDVALGVVAAAGVHVPHGALRAAPDRDAAAADVAGGNCVAADLVAHHRISLNLIASYQVANCTDRIAGAEVDPAALLGVRDGAVDIAGDRHAHARVAADRLLVLAQHGWL